MSELFKTFKLTDYINIAKMIRFKRFFFQSKWLYIGWKFRRHERISSSKNNKFLHPKSKFKEKFLLKSNFPIIISFLTYPIIVPAAGTVFVWNIFSFISISTYLQIVAISFLFWPKSMSDWYFFLQLKYLSDHFIINNRI